MVKVPLLQHLHPFLAEEIVDVLCRGGGVVNLHFFSKLKLFAVKHFSAFGKQVQNVQKNAWLCNDVRRLGRGLLIELNLNISMGELLSSSESRGAFPELRVRSP